MAKKGENIRKRKDGRWEGRYKKGRDIKGSIIYGYVYGRTYGEAREKMYAAVSAAQHVEENAEEERYFSEVLMLWMEHNRIRRKGGTTAKYRFLIDRHILPDLGGLRAAQITATMINAYLAEKLEHGRLDNKGGLSASYVRTIAMIIGSSLKFAACEGMCNSLKSQIYMPSLSKRDLPVLDAEQQKRLEGFASRDISSAKIGVMLSLQTGMRIGEVCALSWDDVDLENRIIHVRSTVARVENTSGGASGTRLIIDAAKTKSSVRDIPVSSVLLPVLAEAEQTALSDFVISDGRGFTSPRTLEYRFHRLLDECRIESINFHALRHTFATRCIEAGVDIKSLSEMLGHASVSVTLETYVHSSMKLKRAQIEKLAVFSA